MTLMMTDVFHLVQLIFRMITTQPILSCVLHQKKLKPRKIIQIQTNVISFPIDDDGDGVLNQEDLCPNDAGLAANGGCPVTPSNDGNNIADESENQGEDVASSNSRALIITIVLGLLMIGTVGFPILRNKEVNGLNSEHQFRKIERCPDCNGIAQEAVENGNRWTWCPECRKNGYNTRDLRLD